MRRLSQVFLQAPAIARLAAEALPLKGKTVLEIGAGKGILTEELEKRAKRVVALEIDPKLVEILAEKFKRSKVEVARGDALKASFNGFDAIVGNLPYHLSSAILFRFLDSDAPAAVFMLQKEFAERLLAEPGTHDYSRLAVMTQAVADVEIIGYAPAECFDPIPRVDSALVKLKRSEKFKLSAPLVAALFQHKNQTVRNALLHSQRALGLPKARLAEFADSLDARNRKVRSLSLGSLEDLSREFKRLL